MIFLIKGPEPSILKEKGKEWLDNLDAAIKDGVKKLDYLKSKYRHHEIKSAIVKETYGKCAYCESKIMHTSFGDIEHIIPKSKNTKFYFLWSNLTLACDICNNRKSEFDPEDGDIIDPYTTEPSDHLTFSGTLMFALGTELGKQTRTILELNRAELLERRRERLEQLTSVLEDLLSPNLSLSARKAIMSDFKTTELADSAPYAAMARAFAAQNESVIAKATA